jgi:hypothetical protein
MPQGFELSERKRLGRACDRMDGEVTTEHPVIIQTISQVRRKIFRDHETGSNVHICPHPITHHGETRVLLEIPS